MTSEFEETFESLVETIEYPNDSQWRVATRLDLNVFHGEVSVPEGAIVSVVRNQGESACYTDTQTGDRVTAVPVAYKSIHFVVPATMLQKITPLH